ncbi:MAG: DNRLRE domain-containing protein [Candidatus Helarchaeota archaeon]
MSKKWLRIFAGVGFILVLLFLNFWLNPGLVVTAQAQGQNPEQPPGLDSKSNLSPVERLKARGAVEIKELRTENSKTFDNGDGTRTLIISTGPIHYKDPITKEFKEIKRQIIKKKQLPLSVRLKKMQRKVIDIYATEEEEEYDYANEENILRSYFKASSGMGNMVRIEKDDDYITWQPVAMKWVNENGEEELIAEVQDVPAIVEGSTIRYEEIFPGVDEEFYISPGQIKDKIIVKEKIPFPLLSGKVKFILEGLLETPKNELLNLLQSPIVIMNNNEVIKDIKSYYIKDDKNPDLYHYFIVLKKDYLINSENYPFIIDPTIRIYSSCDTYIYGANSNRNAASDDHLEAGIDHNGHEFWSLYKFSLSSLPSCASISNATLWMYILPDTWWYPQCPFIIDGKPCYSAEARQITEYWGCSTVTFNNRPSLGIRDDRFYGTLEERWEHARVTSIVQNWLNGDPNYGIVIKPWDSSTKGCWAFYESNERNGGHRAYLEISYNCECSSGSCCDGCCYKSYGSWCSSSNSCSGDDLCQDLACDGSGNCNVPINCSDCGDKTCPSDYCYDEGTDSPTGTNYCRKVDYPSSCNRPCSNGSCQDCTCNPSDTRVATCGICKYCNGCSCANYSYGTSCGSGKICDGNGNCISLTCTYTITSPNGGESWQVGTIHTISWSSSGNDCGSSVKLEYSTNGGSSWTTITSSTNNDGSYSWTVPNTPTSQARVRVVDTSNSGYWDQSNSNFTITSAPTCTYTIISPNGGESWQVGTTQTISWSSSGNDCGSSVKLEYSTNGGSSWTTIISSTSNDGSYSWTVPNTPTSQARVRVVDTSNSGYWDQSNSNFEITSSSSGEDIYEPDNDYSSAKTIIPGETQTHSIQPVGDVDWVKFTLDSTSDVVIETSGNSGDTRLYLYDSNLNQIAFDDDSGAGYFSKIIVNDLSPGTYYVKIDEYGNNNEISSYNIDLTVTPVSGGGGGEDDDGGGEGCGCMISGNSIGQVSVSGVIYAIPLLVGIYFRRKTKKAKEKK